MITPEYLQRITEETERNLAWTNAYILERVIERMYASFKALEEDLIIPATLKDLQKLINAGVLYEDIVAAVTKALPEIQKEVRDAFFNSAKDLYTYEDQILSEAMDVLRSDRSGDNAKALAEFAIENNMSIEQAISLQQQFNEAENVPVEAKDPNKMNLTDAEKAVVEDQYKETANALSNLTHTTADAVQIDYINACDEAFTKVKAGVGIDQAITEAIDGLAKRGITTISYGNRRESMEAAVARAVRTGINQANARLVLTRAAEMGVSYVRTSSHLGARVTKKQDYTNHAHWQGQVYELDWNKPELAAFKGENETEIPMGKYPDFVEACGWGNILGICGVNCRHTFNMFFAGVQDDTPDKPADAENEKRYVSEQHARAMEREIRSIKRRIRALKSIDTQEAKEKVAELDALLDIKAKEYADYCKDNGFYVNSSRVYIGG